MVQKLGHSIRKARRAANLTQDQLGRRLGILGRTIHRWETNQSVPTRRHQRDMLAVLRTYDAAAATALQAAIEAARQGKATGDTTVAVVASPAPTPVNPSEPFELAVLRMADELDLPPRRLRRPLARLFERLRGTDSSLETAQQQLERWIAEQQY
jgi:transcriptional regulator with XRE-family HTH domain